MNPVEFPENKELFPSCRRGWRAGMYEGIEALDTEMQVGKCVQESEWPFPSSRPNPRPIRMGFKNVGFSYF